MDLGLKGKRALVCGSSKGLGLAVAEALAAAGTELCLNARNDAELTAVAADLGRRHGVKTHRVALDLAAAGAPAQLAATATELMGGVDLLVNNVGGPSPSAACATDAAAWQKGFEQIFLSSTLLTTALVPGMRQRRFGRIVTITSISVLEPIEHLVVSTAMRLAVTGYARTLATEVAADGVTVNTVQPGIFQTQRIVELRKAKAARDGTTLAAEMQKTTSQIPQGRLGRPEELASVVAFLCSAQASYLTGVHIPIDGGLRRGL